MPSNIKAGTKRILVQIASPVHAAADERRRAERVTWDQVITAVLVRWAAGGDEVALAAPVRPVRPAGPDAIQARAAFEHAMKTDETYRRSATERVDPASLRWSKNLADLFRADASMSSRVVPPGALDQLEADDGDRDE